ncbi:cell division protein SepF [Butyrivibrio sp. YAB3001]|uniref:cell division protein SepF n=1 Tax=Butyrivibrio sp. YAB3001 TaxID=1520812 RepID=UPI0008F622EE|nr:cell division protein SepF [Butyrivibrio sp. YAB3001]SFB67811.1 cell division inhibitor SepF [Butyrivibrio sp. YAB3001]
MSVMDRFLKAIQLNGEDDSGYYDDDYDDDYKGSSSKIESISSAPAVKDNSSIDLAEERAKKTAPKVVPARSKKSLSAAGMEVCVIKPTSVEDAREITETLLANRTVVLNLEGLDVDIAQRIIDFTSGSTFAISGNLQKISRYIFIITPASVDISGDFQTMINGAFGGGFADGPQQID